MDVYNKRNFWEALIIALFIFGLGILLGYLIEGNRVGEVSTNFQASELNMLDLKAQSDLFNLRTIDCSNAVNETIAFANRIYDEAKLLEKYENVNNMGQQIVQQHMKYDVLRAILFANILKIKDKCDIDFNTILYFYEYQTDNLDKVSLQGVFSKKLTEIKNQEDNKVILIPLAGNIGANSISYIMKTYNITTLPTILINENIKIDSIDELRNINSILVK